MCGILGIWRFDDKPVDLETLGRALTRLRHRGPDDEGYLLVNTKEGRLVSCGGPDTDPALSLPRLESFAGQSFDLAFGFRRLSIIDLSPAGHQPMSYADGRLWIVYNGEIYNHIELRAELRQFGYRFQSGADTEVILAAYQQWGQDCLAHFNGMWAFAIWDAQEKSLFLARDRFGVKPLHMVQQQGKFAFASEIKALVGSSFSGAHGVEFAPDEDAIHRYLAGGVLPSPQEGGTFFRGVQALPPAHWLRVAPDRSTRERFWSLPMPDPVARPADEVVPAYRDLLHSSIRLRLRSDVPVGTCLSGGVDSSSIVCADQPHDDRPRGFPARRSASSSGPLAPSMRAKGLIMSAPTWTRSLPPPALSKT